MKISRFFLVMAAAVSFCGCAALKGQNYSAIGRYHFSKNEFKQAIDYYKRAIDVDSERPDYLTMLGWAYFKLGYYDNAIVVFNRLSEIEPALLDAYIGRGWCNFKKLNYPAAIDYFKQAYEMDSDNAEIFSGMGWCCFKSGDYAAAEMYFNAALVKALKYKTAVSLKTEPEAERGLGYLNFNKGDFKTALKHFKIAVTLMPEWNDARLKWGDCLFALGKYGEAKGLYGQALKYGKTAEIYDKIGWSYFYGKKFKAAQTAFNNALAIDPAYAGSLTGLSEIERKR